MESAMIFAQRALLRGVALIVVNPEKHILILRENKSKPWIGKYAGMDSIPMETKRFLGMESDASALKRLIAEELHGLKVEIEHEARGSFRVAQRAHVSLYVGRTSTFDLPVVNRSKEVDGHRWIPPGDALTLGLRQGASEMVGDYISSNARES